MNFPPRLRSEPIAAHLCVLRARTVGHVLDERALALAGRRALAGLLPRQHRVKLAARGRGHARLPRRRLDLRRGTKSAACSETLTFNHIKHCHVCLPVCMPAGATLSQGSVPWQKPCMTRLHP